MRSDPDMTPRSQVTSRPATPLKGGQHNKFIHQKKTEEHKKPNGPSVRTITPAPEASKQWSNTEIDAMIDFAVKDVISRMEPEDFSPLAAPPDQWLAPSDAIVKCLSEHLEDPPQDMGCIAWETLQPHEKDTMARLILARAAPHELQMITLHLLRSFLDTSTDPAGPRSTDLCSSYDEKRPVPYLSSLTEENLDFHDSTISLYPSHETDGELCHIHMMRVEDHEREHMHEHA